MQLLAPQLLSMVCAAATRRAASGPPFGEDLDYDVASGLLSELHQDGGYARVTCATPLWPDSPFVENGVPPADDGYYYLVRTHGRAGVGTYGDGAPPARPIVRDVLDEQPPCP